MNREQLVEFFDETVAAMRATLIAKNADYSGAVANDAFANFTRVEALGIATTEQGMLTRMTDKLCRLASFVKKGTLQVKDETVSDTALDLAVYGILFAAYQKKLRAAREAAGAELTHALQPTKPRPKPDLARPTRMGR